MQRDVYLARIVLLFLCVVGAFTALGVHLYNLQIVRHDELHAKARRKYTAYRSEAGARGLIFDVHGNPLAGNLACKDILAEPRRFRKDLHQVVSALSRHLEIKPAVLYRRFQRAFSGENKVVEMVVKRRVDLSAARAVEQYSFPGIRLVDTYQRYYPKGAMLANLLGYVSYRYGEEGPSPIRGAAGIERLYDKALSPTELRQQYERDRVGHQLQGAALEKSKPKNGANVYLTIDEPIQHIVEEELETLVESFNPQGAYAVMADPSSGAILAWAQYPSYDPNEVE